MDSADKPDHVGELNQRNNLLTVNSTISRTPNETETREDSSQSFNDCWSITGAEHGVTKEFRAEIVRRLQSSRIAFPVAYYYLFEHSNLDKLRSLGQKSGPRLFPVLIRDEACDPEGKNNLDCGWRPSQILCEKRTCRVTMWEKPQESGRSIKSAVKDSKQSSFFRDYCSEGHLTLRLNQTGCESVIGVAGWWLLPKKITAREGFHAPNAPICASLWHRIVFEHAEYGDLNHLRQWYEHKQLIFPEAFLWHIFSGIAEALCYCRYGTNSPEGESKWDPIIHGDIKPENILLTLHEDQDKELYPRIKLGDFGLAYTTGGPASDVQHFHSGMSYGTSGYMAPEVVVNEEGRRRAPQELHGPHTDIYSLGKTMLRFLAVSKGNGLCEGPFDRHLPNLKRGSEAILWQFYSKELEAVVQQCLDDSPSMRPQVFNLYHETRENSARHIQLARNRQEMAKLNVEEEHLIATSDMILFKPEDQILCESHEPYFLSYGVVNRSQTLRMQDRHITTSTLSPTVSCTSSGINPSQRVMTRKDGTGGSTYRILETRS